MRALVQLVKEASVTVDNAIVGKIGKGLLVLLGVHANDDVSDCLWLKEKLLNLRIFKDAEGKMNHSILDIGGELLVVSQFTLYADCTKGRRPSFIDSAPPEKANGLYEKFIEEVRPQVKKMETGKFGAYMEVQLVNDGPMTFWLDSHFNR